MWRYNVCYGGTLFAEVNNLVFGIYNLTALEIPNFLSTKTFRPKRSPNDTNQNNIPANNAILTDAKSPDIKSGENKSDDDPEEGYDGEPIMDDDLQSDESENLQEIAENIDNSSIFYDDESYEGVDDESNNTGGEIDTDDMELDDSNEDDISRDLQSGDDEAVDFDEETDQDGILRGNPQQKLLLYRDDGLSTETRYGDDYIHGDHRSIIDEQFDSDGGLDQSGAPRLGRRRRRRRNRRRGWWNRNRKRRGRYDNEYNPNNQDWSTLTRYGDDAPYNGRWSRRRRPRRRPWIRPRRRPYSDDWSRMTRYGDDYLPGRRPNRYDRRWPDAPLPISIRDLDDRKGLPDFLMAANIRAVNQFLKIEHDNTLTKRQIFNEKMIWSRRQPRVVRILYRDFVRNQRLDKRSFDRRRQRMVRQLSPAARNVDRQMQVIENDMDMTRKESFMAVNRILEDAPADIRHELQEFVPVIGPLSDNNVPISPKKPVTRYRLLGVESRPSRFDWEI